MSTRTVLQVIATGFLLLAVTIPSWADDQQGVQKLKQARLETARKGLELAERAYQMGDSKVSFEEVVVWAGRVFEAQLALSDKKPDQIAAYESYLKRLKELEEATKKLKRAGIGSELDVLAAQFKLQEIEIALEHVKAK